MKEIKTSTLTFSYLEPDAPAEKTVFYFSLSADNSLNLPPFNNPVTVLLKQNIRVVSVTLPFHEENARPYNIKELWEQDPLLLTTFLKDLKVGINELKDTFQTPYGAAGLSRGSFIALHLSSKIDQITTLCCFAPLLELPKVKDLSTFLLIKKLETKKLHFFVGEDDTLIETEKVKKLHSLLPKSLLKTYPSIGRSGHGTPPNIFEEGALWLARNL